MLVRMGGFGITLGLMWTFLFDVRHRKITGFKVVFITIAGLRNMYVSIINVSSVFWC